MWIFWPFSKKNFGSAHDICADFGKHVETNLGKFIIRDEKHLPHPKRTIFESICILSYTAYKKETADTLSLYAFELAFFQKNVGDQPLHPLGIDMDELEFADLNSDDFARLVRANPSGKERYDRFKVLGDTEWNVMKSTMAKSMR